MLGICLAAAAYSVIAVIWSMASDPSLLYSEAMETLGLAILVVLSVFPVSAMVLAVTSMLVYSTGKRAPWPVVAGLAGGATGFLFTAHLLNGMVQFPLGVVLLGPALATIMGQFGAAWMTVPVQAPWGGEDRLHFDIGQLLVATVWVGVILTLIKRTNFLGPWSMGIVAAWFVFQAVTLWVVLKLVKSMRSPSPKQ